MEASCIAGTGKLFRWGFTDRAKERPGQRSIPRALCWSLAHRIGPPTLTRSQICAWARLCARYSSSVGLGHPSAAWNGREGAKVKFAAASLHRPFRHPTTAVQENGTYGGRGQSRWLRTADGFAVCAASANSILKRSARDWSRKLQTW